MTGRKVAKKPKKAPRPATKRATKRSAKKAARPARTGAPSDASLRITAHLAALDDWRAATLARVRALILAADPAIVEEWKWDVPVWSRDGILCTGEIYKAYVKLTFAKGALLPDPQPLFNAGFGGNVRRAIDLREGDALDPTAFQRLVRAAVAFNRSPPKARAKAPRKA